MLTEQPVGRTVYIGGMFTQLVPPPGSASSAAARNHLAALDVANHALLPWNPDVNGNVRVLAQRRAGPCSAASSG